MGFTIAALTVNRLLPVPVPVSGFVTVMLRRPVVAPAVTVTGTVMEVELPNVDAPAVTPVPLKVTTAPDWKPVPDMVTVVGPVPWV